MKRWIHVSGVSQLSTSLNDSLKGLTRHRTPSYNLLSISWTLEIWPLTYQVVSRGSHVSASEIFPPVSGHVEYTPSSSGEMLQYVCSVSAQGSWPLTQILGVLLGATHVGKTISLLLLPTLSSWAPKRVFLPSIIRASRMRLSLVQKQRKVLFDQNGKKPAHTPESNSLPQPGAGLLCRVLVGEGEWSTHQAAPLCPSDLSAGCTLSVEVYSPWGPGRVQHDSATWRLRHTWWLNNKQLQKWQLSFFGLFVSSV